MNTINAKITRVSNSKKSIMVFVPESAEATANPIAAKNASRKNAYLALPEELQGKQKVGEFIDIPMGYTLVEKSDENGELMTYSDGEPILFLQW